MADPHQQTEQQEKRADRDEHTVEDLDVLDKEADEVKGGVGLNYGSVEWSYNKNQ